MACLGVLNFSSIIFIEEMYIVALASKVIIISSSRFNHLFIIFSISISYFSNFVVIANGEDLLLQYVNLMNCILELLSRFIDMIVLCYI